MADDFIRSNVSDIARKLRRIVKNKSVLSTIGESLEKVTFESFSDMVANTPQWTGTTAASWNIGFVSRGLVTTVRTQPELTRKNALRRGHGAAVNIAIQANRDKVVGAAIHQKNFDMYVNNHAPGAYTAEYGPVRSVNQPEGPLMEFEHTLYRKLAWINGLNRQLLK